MSKTRKILGIVMAVAMLFNIVAVAAFAADDSVKTNTWAISSTAFTTEPTVSGTFTVAVDLTANYYLGPVQFALSYDDASFSIAASGAVVATNYPYDATIQYNYDTATDLLKVVIVPDTTGLSTLDAQMLSTATTIATITFTYLKAGTISLVNDYKTDANIDGTLCAFRSTQEDLLDCGPDDLLYGQTATVNNPVDNIIGTLSSPELAVIDGMGGVIDNVNMYIYGVELENGEALTDVFEVTDGGYFTVDDSTYQGTGMTVSVYDAGDVLLNTYTFIYFGDIDGDGTITPLDANIAELHDGWSYGLTGRIEDPAALLAGDVDGDLEITTLDANIFELHDSWSYGLTGRLSQAEVIALL